MNLSHLYVEFILKKSNIEANVVDGDRQGREGGGNGEMLVKEYKFAIT